MKIPIAWGKKEFSDLIVIEWWFKVIKTNQKRN